MTARPLHAVLRALADTGPPESDAALLKRFAAERCDEAFARLVHRHGRLVWAVCRQLCRSDADADDAFQATFLVLVRNAGGVKDAAKLSAWLHGVAYKVCGKARQGAKRRAKREETVARVDHSGPAVPDSAWDRALAAVHEEVAGLPDTLRVPFVMCCLEGKGQTEAAEQLGWKLGTLSGRLTRAKDAVLARLSARGLTLGVLAGLGLGGVPAVVSAKAMELGHAGFAVPGSVLQLSTGVIGMSMNKVKLLAAGVLAACGLAVSGGAGWVQKAEAQTSLPAQSSPADRVKQLEAELAKAKADAQKAKAEADKAAAEKAMKDVERARKDTYTLLGDATKGPAKKGDGTAMATAKWEYEFVDMAETFDAGNLALFLQEREKAGWEFLGSSALGKNGGVPMWLFRKAKGGATATTTSPPTPTPTYTIPPYPTAPKADPNVPAKTSGLYAPPVLTTPAPTPVADDPKALEAEIKRLQDRLDTLKKRPKPEAKDPTFNPPVESKPPLPPTPVKPIQPVEPKEPPAKAPSADTKPNPEPKEQPVTRELPKPVAEPKPMSASVPKVQEKGKADWGFGPDELPLGAEEVAGVLRKLVEKKFGKGAVTVTDNKGWLLVTGDEKAVEWVKATLDALRK